MASLIDFKSRLSKLAVPENDDEAIALIHSNPEKVIADSVSQKGLNEELAKKYVIQVQEMSQITSEDDGGFKAFIDFYFKNPKIESLRDETDNSISDYINPEISAFLSEDDEDVQQSEEADDENKGAESSGEQYKEGPNDKSAFVKATQEIRDFFSIMPIVTKRNADGYI
jgi:translation initiation factor 2 beta subunit (eIF-2beta)/eIF-5